MLLVCDEHEIPRSSRLQTGHTAYFEVTIANQADMQCLGNLLDGALHGSHCIAAGFAEGIRIS